MSQKSLIRIRNNNGVNESVRRLVAFSPDVIVDNQYHRSCSGLSDIDLVGLVYAFLCTRLVRGNALLYADTLKDASVK
jgi:hypothetical protein